MLAVGDAPRYTEPSRSWRGPKLILVHDQLELIAHWATEGDAAATHALLRRLHACCEALDVSSTREAQPREPQPREEL